MPLPMVQRLGRLYRQTASDLAYARTYFPGSTTVSYLNQLVSQSHSMIYAEEPQRLKTIWRFLRDEVPQTVRGAWRPLLLAVALMAVGGFVGCFAVLQDPNLAEALTPPGLLEYVVTPEERYEAAVSGRALMGTTIMLNNIKVGFLAFALGITLGIGTAVVVFYNGVIVGAVVAQAIRTGHAFALWGFLLAHGALELTAIFLCGAAGFAMGWPMVSPGEMSRKEALAEGARRAVKLVAVSVPFFVVAAVIEGWITPMTSLSVAGKYMVGAGTGLMGLAYLFFSGRRATADPAP